MKIIIKSQTHDIPAQTFGKGTWAEFTRKAHTSRSYIITTIHDDGAPYTQYTNCEGEGLFHDSSFDGNTHQELGTGQFSVPNGTRADVERFFRNRYKEHVVEFDFTDF